MEFVVCDDEKLFREKVRKIIDKIFITNDEYYRIIEFDKFNDKFKKLINDGKSKIYILDIEINDTVSGIDIARQIRRNDWESIIIFITSHTELGYQALKAQIMLLDFISKFDDCEKNLDKVLRKAISQVNNHKTITFVSEGISYIIHLDDILYIMKDSVDRKCVIKTSYNEIIVNKTLSSMMEVLDDRFYMSHRSCVINTERLSNIDWRNSVITFDNGENIDLLSRDRKKGLKKYVGV